MRGFIKFARYLGLGVLLGAATGAVYALVILTIAGGGPPGKGEILLLILGLGVASGGAGGAVTGLVAFAVAALCGARFTALGWWLGGALGGLASVHGLSLLMLPHLSADLLWYGIPAVVGSAAGALFGWWLQRRERKGLSK